MELVYLWIKSYKNIEEQEFNLSSKYKIYFNSKKEIIVKRMRDRIFNNKINDIIGIIGENGSGKSAVLEIIQSLYSNNRLKKILILKKMKYFTYVVI